MTVEIIALVEKNYGQTILEEMNNSQGVLKIFNASVFEFGFTHPCAVAPPTSQTLNLKIFCLLLEYLNTLV